MPGTIEQLYASISAYLPTLVAALAVLVVGWLVAVIAAGLTRRLLERTTIDDRIARWVAGKEDETPVEVERWVSRGVFWLIMLFVLVSFFQVLGLAAVTEPLNQLLVQVFAYLPRLVAAAALLLVAWILASALRYLVTRALRVARLEERLGAEAGVEDAERVPLSRTVGEAVYWLVFLFFLPALLDALGLQGLLEPVQGMVNQILSFLPSLFGAALILAVGWLVARIVQRVITNVLEAVGVDRVSDKAGLGAVLGEQRLSAVLGLIVYFLVLIPVLIAALNALTLEAITRPASNMLNAILLAIPAIAAAALVLVIAYVVGRVVAGLVTNLLTAAGFNSVLSWLGLGRAAAPGRSPSEIVGYLVLVAILLFAAIEAASLLGFGLIAQLLSRLIVFAGQVVLGLVIFAIGLYLANVAAGAVRDSGVSQARLLAVLTRAAIVVFAGAMALGQMGLAGDIVNLAFTLLLGALAVAAALAFGLGGREVAGRELERWVVALKGEEGSSASPSPRAPGGGPRP